MEYFRRLLLIILDGWGLNDNPKVSAIARARTPFFDYIYSEYPHTTLITHGRAVGLPDGQMGNSEVGHLNIGAGRIVWQDIMRIYNMIESGELESHPVIQKAISYLKENPGKKLHICGLTSTGGVHSHVDHLRALVKIFCKAGIKHVYIHAFTDGRDTDIHQAAGLVPVLEQEFGRCARIVSIIGRYYAMDRDKRWDRTYRAYRLLVEGEGIPVSHTISLKHAILDQYNKGIGDEFLEPIVVVDDAGKPVGRISNGDVLLCFNFRKDRCRQLLYVLTQGTVPGWEDKMRPLDLFAILMTRYDRTWKNIHVILEELKLVNTWGEWLSKHGLTQLRIAETEKYPHVTYFFSGGREEPFPGEERILVPSPRDVPTYDKKPEMSAYEVTDRLIARLNTDQLPDFICLNFANPDMVGHTGVFDAIVKAVEAVDECMGKVIQVARGKGYSIIVTADHGNAYVVFNSDGSVHTAHTKNPVPFIIVDDNLKKVKLATQGILADIAVTGLNIMGLPVPEEMEGKNLILK